MSSAFETQEWESNEMEGVGEWESQEQFLGGELEASGESQEAELATELLEITSEEELEQFLGNLIRGAAKAVGGFVRSPVGRALGGVLKNVAKTGAARRRRARWATSWLPGVGGALGSKLGSMATNLFELELEGMDEQEAEFEVARRYVRFATAAARNAARAPRSAPPRAVARAAVIAAARRHAPGLLPRRPAGPGRPRRAAGGPDAAASGARQATAFRPATTTGGDAGYSTRSDTDQDGTGDDDGAGRRRATPGTGAVRTLDPTWPQDRHPRGVTGRTTMSTRSRRRFLEQEARALLTRLDQVRPFALHETMVPGRRAAAAPRCRRSSGSCSTAGASCGGRVLGLPAVAARRRGRARTPSEQQRRFTLIRLRSTTCSRQFDLFTEAITQRSEHQTGVWLSGLDVLATDALQAAGRFPTPRR